jgi:hypothetical protein
MMRAAAGRGLPRRVRLTIPALWHQPPAPVRDSCQTAGCVLWYHFYSSRGRYDLDRLSPSKGQHAVPVAVPQPSSPSAVGTAHSLTCRRNSRRQNMITKTTIALAAALFLAAVTAGQAGDGESHERQNEGFSFHRWASLSAGSKGAHGGPPRAEPTGTCRGMYTSGTIVLFDDFGYFDCGGSAARSSARFANRS